MDLLKPIIWENRLNTRLRSWMVDLLKKWTPIKNRLIRKTRPQELKTLSVVSSHMSDNFKVIHFHMKIRDWQGLLFVQILYGNCTSNFCFESWYKSGNCQFLALISMERFRMFTHFYAALFLIKACFYETSNVFLSRVLDIFPQNC